jgi:hypothetical protein
VRAARRPARCPTRAPAGCPARCPARAPARASAGSQRHTARSKQGDAGNETRSAMVAVMLERVRGPRCPAGS